MKSLLIGAVVGILIGMGLTILYFSLATFFAANAKMASTFNTNQEGAKNVSENAEVATTSNTKRSTAATL